MTFKVFRILLVVAFLSLFMLTGCGKREKITHLQQLDGKEIAVPTGTVVDKLLLTRFPNAKFKYYNNTIDAVLSVKAGQADAAADDEPILRNIVAKNGGLVLLPEMITIDNYAFGVQANNHELKNNIDRVITDLKNNGDYDEMIWRWFPKSGNPKPMRAIPSSETKGVLRLGTSSLTEPFSFMDGSGGIVGLDIELARYVAKKLDKKLVIVNMEFGALIPALISGKVDMIASCITITEERAKQILFSEPYYIGGIGAVVSE